jgi:ribonuclease-3
LADLSLLQKKIGVRFNRLSLLELALVHGSYLNENPGAFPASNERLEFLGDAVLGLVIAESLYQAFQDSPEGELTRLRSALVRRETLARIAGQIGLGDYLYLGVGEEGGGGRRKPANLAGAFEALVAAIYLDQGLNASRSFINVLVYEGMYSQATRAVETDYKSKLQEMMQANRQVTPSYHLIEAVGPDHARQFTVEVKVGDTVLGQGSGKTKKAAEMEAARIALEKL